MECLWDQGVVCQENLLNSAFFVWFIIGIVLIILEAVVPGIYLSILGLGAIFTAGIVFIAPISIPFQLLIWVMSSTIVILSIGQFLKNFFPSSKSFSKSAIENDYSGKIVKVIEDIHPGELGGRIHFQGTDWTAKSISSTIPKGSFARIYDRDNISFLVEAIESEDKSS
jgi:inner membrane protein